MAPAEAPSAVSRPVRKELPRKFRLEKVKRRVTAFGDCALGAKRQALAARISAEDMDVSPDVLIIAPDSTPIMPAIPGIRHPLVISAVDFPGGKVDAPDKLAVMGGGRMGLGRPTISLPILEGEVIYAGDARQSGNALHAIHGVCVAAMEI